MTPMRVKALIHNPETEQASVVLETQAGDLALGFMIPMNEANRLARVLGLTRCRCAPIYDLVLDLIETSGVSVSRSVLDCETEGIYATLVLEGTAAPVALRCHPADAIALALRTSAPIYATADALAHACPLTHSHGQAIDHRHVAQWLERVRPDDFAPRSDQE